MVCTLTAFYVFKNIIIFRINSPQITALLTLKIAPDLYYLSSRNIITFRALFIKL